MFCKEQDFSEKLKHIDRFPKNSYSHGKYNEIIFYNDYFLVVFNRFLQSRRFIKTKIFSKDSSYQNYCLISEKSR